MKCYRTKIIIHHINVLLNHPDNVFSFIKKYFIRIAKLYSCIILINIRNIYNKYCHCGPIHFKFLFPKKSHIY